MTREYAGVVSELYAWLRRHPMLVDSWLAVLLAVISLPSDAQRPWEIPVTVLMVAPIAVRRRIPIWALTVCLACAIGQLFGPGPLPSDLAVLVLIYTIAAYRPRRYSVLALITCLFGAVIAVLVWAPLQRVGLAAGVYVGAVLFGGSALLAWTLGDSMRFRRGYYAALEERAARLEADRHVQAKMAAAAERARIARELHDVIAHHVSVMVVQADGASYAMRADLGKAEAALKAISRTGRQALTEMRALLGVLRAADDQTALAPLPGLGELRELLDQARTAGLAVSYTLTGNPRELPEGAELAAYRVVQESLTNTRKHGGPEASASVTLRYEPDGLVVEVTDDGIALPGSDNAGHGLAGMRERVEMYGGTVQAGPMPGGGFRVLARLPSPSREHAGRSGPPDRELTSDADWAPAPDDLSAEAV
jgi:signal transduction histidine kinase